MSFQLTIAWAILCSPVIFAAWMFCTAKPDARKDVVRVLGLMVGFILITLVLSTLFYWALITVFPGLR